MFLALGGRELAGESALTQHTRRCYDTHRLGDPELLLDDGAELAGGAFAVDEQFQIRRRTGSPRTSNGEAVTGSSPGR
jgi:hypothetical protein